MSLRHRYRLSSAIVAAVLFAFVGVLLWSRAGEPVYTAEDAEFLKKVDAAAKKIKPLHTRLGKPQPGDWLSRHEEPGQTFNQYLTSRPVTIRKPRDKLYIQPLGEFKGKSREIIDKTADFMARYFNVEVKIREPLSLDVIPEKARRVHPEWRMKQILAGHVLDDVLKPRLPRDAAAYIAFTTSDLWPGRGWNFVFGMASLSERVGVWSIYRNGDPEAGDAAFRLCLLRTIKTATHETGHMFSMKHCTLYECNMCGSNHRAESDRRPVFCCPECAAKIWWACRADPLERYRKLAEFYKANGFKDEHAFCLKSIAALGGKEPSK